MKSAHWKHYVTEDAFPLGPSLSTDQVTTLHTGATLDSSTRPVLEASAEDFPLPPAVSAPTVLTSPVAEPGTPQPITPYPLSYPVYQRHGRWGNSLSFSGTTLTPPSKEIYWPITAASALATAAITAPVRAIGGLRHLAPAMKRLPLVSMMGGVIYTALSDWFLSEPDSGQSIMESVLGVVGHPTATTIRSDLSRQARKRLFAALKPHVADFDTKVIPPVTESTCINTELLGLWMRASRDPDDLPVEWLRHGAPAGIVHDIESRGIFPQYTEEEDTATVDAELLRTDPDHCNYSGVEDDQEVADELDRLHEQQFVRKFDSLESVSKYLKGPPVLSKLGVIRKTRGGITKNRLVVDSKRSRVSSATRKFERTLLPRALDVVHDGLDLMATHDGPISQGAECADGDTALEFLIADFKDAFYILPNRRDERRFFVIVFRGVYYVFMKTTQGSRGAPLTWARLVAVITRMTQAVTGIGKSRISTYVDDPIIAVLAPKRERDRLFSMILLIWSALDFPLSLKKAVRSFSVTWTSAIFTPYPGGIQVQVKEAIVEDAMDMTAKLLLGNTISKKKLRSYTGKLTHISSIVQAIRPFLTDLYGAIYATSGHAPRGCIWRRQIVHVLTWMTAFFKDKGKRIVRRYDLAPFMKTGIQVTVDLDASPWGLGGYLSENGVITSWFASSLSVEELAALDIKSGDCAAQQTVEALAVLVALRAWHPRWAMLQPTIRVRSDSVSALTIALKLKTKGRGPSIVAREMALDMAEACYYPHVAEHVPGVDNTVADMLSRKYMPGGNYTVPECLLGVEQLLLPMRDRSDYRSLPATALV